MRRYARYAAMMLCDAWLARKPRLRGRPDTRTALVRLDTVGDFLLWLEAGRETARRLGAADITLIGNAAWADYAKQLGGWNKVIAVDIGRLGTDLSYRILTLRQIGAQNFTVAINPTYSRDFMLDDAVMRATGAAERIGWVADGSNIARWQTRISDRWYDRLIAPDPAPKDELQRNEEFVSKLFGGEFRARLPALPAGPALPAPLATLRAYFVVAPGAAWKGKRWPAARFAGVIRQVRARTGWRPVMTGTAGEAALCAEVLRLAGDDGVNMAGTTSLAELTEVIRSARLVIANDSAAVHIAAAVGCPAVCILGGGHFGRFAPYPARDISASVPSCVSRQMECFGCKWKCVVPHDKKGPVPCVLAVDEQDVVGAFERMELRA